MAKLSPEQQQQVETWAEGGATLNDIQNRLNSEFGISLTYLDARMPMIEIGIRLKEKVREAPQAAVDEKTHGEAPTTAGDQNPAAAVDGSLSVTADEIPAAGAIASGKATFSDGITVIWFVDQTGRLGIKAPEPGYQPPPADIPVFEERLDALLRSL